MRGSIPGTRHTTLLDRREPEILAALAGLPFVRKLEPTFLNWTGPSRPRLRLSQISAAVLVGSLSLGTGKRRLLLFLRREVELSLKELGEALSNAVSRFCIEVELNSGGKTMKTDNPDEAAAVALHQMAPDEAWSLCLAIHQCVTEFKKAEDEEVELELRLEELRQRKAQLQQSALKCIGGTRHAR